MAAGLSRRAPLAGVVLAAVLCTGCGLDLAETPPPSGPLPTPLGSLTPALTGTLAALDAALVSSLGVGLDDALEGYRPAEPPAFAYVPRTVAKVRLPNDPNLLYIVLYAFADPSAAAEAGRQAAAFYGSGPALVQFPSDARFALGQVGEVLLFAAWSPGATSDRERAGAAFEVIRGFGQPIPISP